MFWSVAGLGLIIIPAGNFAGERENHRIYQFSPDAKDGQYTFPGAGYQNRVLNPETGSFQIQINAEPQLAGNKCNLMIANPPENEQDIRVTLVMDQTGAVVYQSDILKPGQRQPYVVFSEEIQPGEHAAAAIFEMLDDSGQVCSTVETGIRITH